MAAGGFPVGLAALHTGSHQYHRADVRPLRYGPLTARGRLRDMGVSESQNRQVLTDEYLDRLLSVAWGKTDVRPGQLAVTRWLPTSQHLMDSAGVAGWLWDDWLPFATRDTLASALGGAEQARATMVFLAGIHDIGKVTPAFVLKQRELAQIMAEAGWPMPGGLSPDDLRRLPHGLAGYVILSRYLTARGWARDASDTLGAIVGGHHGFMPSTLEIQQAQARVQLLGAGPVWAAAQERLIERALELAQLDLEALHGHLPGTHAQALLAGIVVVADWVASDSRGFSLSKRGYHLEPDPGRLRQGLDIAALPSRWCISGFDGEGGVARSGGGAELLGSRFPALTGRDMRPVQAAAIESARVCDPHSLIIIEAPMGVGKTEAALLAAEVLASRSGSGGFAFFLPTQATAGAQFGRFVSWIKALTTGAGGDGLQRAVALLHGKAWLDPVFSRLPGSSAEQPRGARIYDDDSEPPQTPYVHHWMTNRLTSPLSDGVVGTIDQLLTMALQSRHVALRHLALAGKVVVIDEVHSYDAYMNVYLERALAWLGASKVPVIMLSATLPSDQRQRLIAAYEGKRNSVERKSSWRQEPGSAARPVKGTHKARTPYPAVTFTRSGVTRTQAVEHTGASTRVTVEPLGDDDADIIGLLRESLERGGCAAVIRNTVKRAQKTYRALVAEYGVQNVTLAHARFLARDRADLDAGLLARFGPGGSSRPQRHIVVATQVIEQSLDLDFDLMVTDIAPTDLLLQRIGRVHRHEREREEAVSTPRCFVTGVVDWEHQPPMFAKAMGAIYAEYDLLQAAALVLRSGGVTLPEDIPAWVEGAYSQHGVTPAHWSNRVADALRARTEVIKKKETAAAAFRIASPDCHGTLVGWSNRSQMDGDDEVRGRAQVRDGDDTFDVIVGFRDRYGDITVAPWHTREDGVTPRVDSVDSSSAEAIAACSTRISSRQLASVGGDIDRLIEECERDTPVTWADHPRLKGQLLAVLDVDADGQGGRNVRGGAYLEYRRTEGLRIGSAQTGEGRKEAK